MTAYAFYRSSKPRSALVLALCSTLWTWPVGAFELGETLQLHGFVSQGFSFTSENDFFGDSRDGGSFDFTELGLNASWRPLNRLQLSAQLLSRRAGEGDKAMPRLDYGLVDYSLRSSISDRWGVRLGRVKNPIGFYNETRDVLFTRPGVLLPQSIYPDQLRRLALSSDGLYAYGERRTDLGDFFLHAGVGFVQADDDNLEASLFGSRVPGTFESDLSYVARLLYEWDGGRIRAAMSYFRSNLEYEPDAGSGPPRGSLRAEPWILSLQYNAEHWSLTGEYSRNRLRSRLGSAATFTSEGGYLQGIYRLGRQWELLLRYDAFYTDTDDHDGEDFAATDLLGRPAHSRFAKDWTVGVNWNFSPRFTLRAEYHRVDGTAWLPALDNPGTSGTEPDWDLFLLMGGYRF